MGGKTIPCLALLPMLLWMQPRTLLAYSAVSAHCQDMLSFSSTITPKYFSPGLLSVPVFLPACTDTWDCHNPHAGSFTWLNFRKLPTSQSCQDPSGKPSLQHDYHTTQLGVINKLAEGALATPPPRIVLKTDA